SATRGPGRRDAGGTGDPRPADQRLRDRRRRDRVHQLGPHHLTRSAKRDGREVPRPRSQGSPVMTAQPPDALPEWMEPVADLVGRPERDDVFADWPTGEGNGARPASVLVLFGEGELGPDVLLLERAHDMRSHAG